MSKVEVSEKRKEQRDIANPWSTFFRSKLTRFTACAGRGETRWKFLRLRISVLPRESWPSRFLKPNPVLRWENCSLVEKSSLGRSNLERNTPSCVDLSGRVPPRLRYEGWRDLSSATHFAERLIFKQTGQCIASWNFRLDSHSQQCRASSY